MMRALAMLGRLLARPAEPLDRIRRLVDPRRWSAAVRVLADLLNGGIVVPPPEPTAPGREAEEPKVEIYSVIQPDGDIQLKVARSLLESGDVEAKLARHLEAVEEALKKLRDAAAQVLLLRVVFALPSLAALLDSLHSIATGLERGASGWEIAQELNWAFLGVGGLFLLACLFLARLLGWFIGRRLGFLARDLKNFEGKSYGAEAGQA